MLAVKMAAAATRATAPAAAPTAEAAAATPAAAAPTAAPARATTMLETEVEIVIVESESLPHNQKEEVRAAAAAPTAAPAAPAATPAAAGAVVERGKIDLLRKNFGEKAVFSRY